MIIQINPKPIVFNLS